MEVKINKEIRNYTESMFFVLSLRQFIFSVLDCGVAVGLYFLPRPRFGTETLSWFCILGVFPFKFEDINYAVASREDKETMFLEYSELLNSLDSGATTKITINNRRWNKADFEQTILIPMADDDLDKYRKIGMKIRNEAKGGMLVASIVGVDMRATMDIDTTVKALPLNEKDARAIIERIGELQLEDGVNFKITSVKEIMEEFDYPGIRMMIEANLERMRQPFKIDISTDDAITPGAVEYKYKLMFEDRSISVLSYNLETLLAEKMQTILARGLANTRMRDFYDVYEIMNSKADQISFDVLKKAFAATCMKRETSFGEEEVRETLDKIKDDSGLEEMWNRFKRVNYFVDDLPWGEISETIVDNIEKISFFSDQVSWISDEKGIKDRNKF